MSTHDTIVIGAGLFGSVIARELRRRGEDVLVIDSEFTNRGSLPAACLMKPSWFSGLNSDVRRAAFGVLEANYAVATISFHLAAGLRTDVSWINPASILNGAGPAVVRESVTRIEGKHVWTTEGPHIASRVVVAAGVWSPSLLGLSDLLVRPQAGSAFLWRGAEQPTSPMIRIWAPYKQLVRFNRGDGVWVGDGTSLKPDSLTQERRETSRSRCADFAFLPSSEALELTGYRPYAPAVKKLPAWVEELRPGLWIATGGAKNGTIAAGWAAHTIVNGARS